MVINDTNIEFYNQDEEYIKNQLINYYKTFLNDLVIVLTPSGIATNNKILHEMHKLDLDMVSIKEENRQLYTTLELVEALSRVEEYWKDKVPLSFLP